MDKKKITIRAAEGSPEEVTQGNMTVTLRNGCYETDHAKFAEYLEREYGVKEAPKPAAAAQPAALSIPRPAMPPAANKAENETNTGGDK